MNPLRAPITIRGVTIPNRLFLAPVDGVFDRPYRVIARRHGVGLTCSEMVSARGFAHGGKKLRAKLAGDPSETPYQAQLSEHDPEPLAAAARRIEAENLAQIVDLNLGCPSKLVTGSGNGSALLRDPMRVASILRAMREALTIPLSVKIRAGWDEQSRNYLEIARIAQEEGADFITVHGRTRAQMFGGRADWSVVAEVKRVVSIPVIGNGDLFSASDARSRLAETGCDGLMVARGAFGNPWLIDRILGDDDRLAPSLGDLLRTILEHVALSGDHFGETLGVKMMRKHLAWYVKGLPEAARFRREALILTDRSRLEETIRSYIEGLTQRGAEFVPAFAQAE